MTTQSIQLELGFQVIRSYKRLSYTPWHAIAELVDNATQSYFDNRDTLDEALSEARDNLTVGIVYDRAAGLLRVSDNAMGMSHDELTRALRVGVPPENTSGRSKYGMGMKTASCWIGNRWTVRTKKLGETQEHYVTIDVDKIANGDNDLSYHLTNDRPRADHYTIIEIRNHNQVFQGRTIGKIKDFLRSIYRQDLRNEWVTIEWQGSPLEWDDADFQFRTSADGSPYKKDFEFIVNGKNVKGWVGILNRGSRANAGFSILHAERVVRGWPESWRPEAIYGAYQGRNDLVNQRLVGEIHLDGFDVSHTKDDILWNEDEQEQVEQLLKKSCDDYIATARQPVGGGGSEGGPTDVDVQTALEELQAEISSPEFFDAVTLDDVPPPAAVNQALQPLKLAIGSRVPTFHAKLEQAQFEVLGFLVNDSSVNDPYVVVESTNEARVQIIINTQHPHWHQLAGDEGALNYLRHCTYDGVAEWQARRKSASLDPDTIKVLKDKLLRISLEIENKSVGG